MNNDGAVNTNDLASLIGYLLSNEATGVGLAGADCSLDGNVNTADVSLLIDYLLTGAWPEAEDPHEYVDLGLPSGTLWATCNVGADRPEEYGDYFAWGETAPKEDYSWSTYKWCNGGYRKLTKYCTNDNFGAYDDKDELDSEDDAAYVNWGSSWRMPTLDQARELHDRCTVTWTTLNGVNGSLVTGPNGNTIFFPAGGEYMGTLASSVGSIGVFWTLKLYFANDPSTAYCGLFSSYGLSFSHPTREVGMNIRPVRAQ